MIGDASPAEPARARAGVWYSLSAYTLWGLFPLYFKALAVSPFEFLLHRVIWSAALLSALVSGQKGWPAFRAALRARGAVLGAVASASLLTVNWFVYIWAVTSERVVDASLGYFINPFVSVVLGVALLRERLRPLQWSAIAIAGLGVVWLSAQLGQPPWVGLVLAASFGTYGVLRKMAPLGSFDGLMLEALLLLPLAASALAWLAARGESGFLLGSASERALLVFSGPLTVVPLLLFAAGARRIPLSLMGVLQYVAPTLQLGLGVFLWHEPFGAAKAFGYGFIWLALAFYGAEGVWVRRARRGARAGA